MARRRSRGGSNIGFIVVLAALVMLVLAIVGVCLNWVNTSVSFSILGIDYSDASANTLGDLFNGFDGAENDAANAFRLMASFAIITVILTAATTVLAGICKVLHWKLFRFILVIVAIVCVICGVVTIITSYTFCSEFMSVGLSDILKIIGIDLSNYGIDLSGLADVKTTPAAGMWLTSIGGILGGLIGVGAAVKN